MLPVAGWDDAADLQDSLVSDEVEMQHCKSFLLSNSNALVNAGR